MFDGFYLGWKSTEHVITVECATHKINHPRIILKHKNV